MQAPKSSRPAGSPWKRDLLRSWGVEHVFDSRTPAFSAEILARTAGRGVDIVLNSLAGDLIEPSFAALARGGRFVEIGKRGIKDEAWVAAQKKDWRYFIVDWGDTAGREPALIGGMYARLVSDLRAGRLAPLPRHVFTLDDVSQAFRFMAQARHAGKIVVRHAAQVPLAVSRNGTYLITGGPSGLGLRVARWLAEEGAGRLALLGRRGVTPEAQAVLEEIRATGTQVVAEALDISDETAVKALLTRLRTSGPASARRSAQRRRARRCRHPAAGRASLRHRFRSQSHRRVVARQPDTWRCARFLRAVRLGRGCARLLRPVESLRRQRVLSTCSRTNAAIAACRH